MDQKDMEIEYLFGELTEAEQELARAPGTLDFVLVGVCGFVAGYLVSTILALSW